MTPALRNALLCAVCLLAAPALADDGFGVIRGTVLSREDRGTLAGVFVLLHTEGSSIERTTFTDERGFYWFPQLPPGTYIISFYLDDSDYQPYARTVRVRLNQTEVWNVELGPWEICDCEVAPNAPVSVPLGVRPSGHSRPPAKQ